MWSIKQVQIFWKKHGYETTLIVCLLFLMFLGIYRHFHKQSGTFGKTCSNLFNGKKRKVIAKKRSPDSKGELKCREVLEKVFQKPFNKIRPDFLRNPVTSQLLGSRNLELDCYNDELGLAVEYQGAQHYEYIPFFHKNKEAFQNQKYRDYVKRTICEKNGIYLIEVPYTVHVDKIESFLLDKLSSSPYNKWLQSR
jgi:hypothetical protein